VVQQEQLVALLLKVEVVQLEVHLEIVEVQQECHQLVEEVGQWCQLQGVVVVPVGHCLVMVVLLLVVHCHLNLQEIDKLQ
jgi:NADH:ubiquinone oxidoreductase subunit K